MTTIRDVARQSGLSVSTVSRVLNDAKDVSSEAREAVLAAAADLNYQPHKAARNLRRCDKGEKELQYTIGLVLLDQVVYPTEPFFMQLLASVDQALRKQNFSIKVFPCSRNGGIPREIEEGLVDGVIFQQASGYLIPAIAALIPVVTMGGFYPKNGTFGIYCDYQGGIAEAAGRLYKSGHRRLALFCDHQAGPEGMATFMSMSHEGAAQAFEAHGAHAAPPVFYPVAGTPDEGYRLGRELFADPGTRPDAVIASDGAMLGLYRAVHEAGLSIPDDISFVGTDGIPESAFLIPPLTVCDSHFAEMGTRAVEVLIEMVQSGQRRCGMEMIPMTFTPRASANI